MMSCGYCHWTWWIIRSTPYELISGRFSHHSTAQIDLVFHPIDLSACYCLHDAAYCHFMRRFLTSFTLNMRSVAPVARDNRALPALSIFGWFFLLPWLGYAVGSVARSACHLALADARAPLVAMYGDAQSDNKLATIPSGRRVVELAGPLPRCGVPALPPHDGRSDSPAR